VNGGYECRACGEVFGGLDAFDTHRVGTHQYTSTEGLAMNPPREDGRRCLSTWEMEERGFGKTARGRWSISRRLKVRPSPTSSKQS
jgi:hypothetical protein